MNSARPCALALGVALALAAAGCAQVEGDFGRPKRDLFREEVFPVIGGLAAKARGEPVSMLARTDEERELRDLAHAFLTPPEGFRMVSYTMGEMRAARILPNAPAVVDPELYSQSLLSYNYRSTTARWQRLTDDIRSDRQRIAPFVRVANRVIDNDRVRRKAMEHFQSLSPEQRAEAVARMDENALLISDVCRAMHDRGETYRHAMEALVVAQPAPMAIEAERALTALRETNGGLDCASIDAVPGPRRVADGDRVIVRKD